MKRLIQGVFLVICVVVLGAVLFFFVRQQTGAAAASRPVATRQVTISQDATGSAESSNSIDRSAQVNHINAEPNEVILDVSPVSLGPGDSGEGGEGSSQILTVRKTSRTEGRLWIVVAAYVPEQKAWVRAWEGETEATKLTTFSVQTRDLVGDHGIEIVCLGMDDKNEQTISVFRREPGAKLPKYKNVCSFAADSITIGDVERSEGYQLGQTRGESLPVFGFSRDRDSPNILDQIKTTWAWDQRKLRYVKGSETKIPGAQVEREAITKVLTGSEKDFETFLEGVWCETGKAVTDPGAKMLVFDRPAGAITFYSNDNQEVFLWTESHSTRYGIYAGGRNESVSNLRRLMDIELTGADQISIRVFEDLAMKVDPEDSWDGSYLRLALGGSTSDYATAARSKALFKLEGGYKSADGSEVFFTAPRYSTRKSNQAGEHGAFELYQLGSSTVLSLTSIGEDGLVRSRQSYQVQYSESRFGKSLIRRLTLSPARLSISGLERLEKPALVLEQRVEG